MVTLARRRAIDGLRKKQAYARAEERLQNETEQQPDAWVHNATEEEIVFGDTRDTDPQSDQWTATGAATGNRPRIF